MATFRELHNSDEPLLLPNPWDVGSALAFAAAGFSRRRNHQLRHCGQPRPARRRPGAPEAFAVAR